MVEFLFGRVPPAEAAAVTTTLEIRFKVVAVLVGESVQDHRYLDWFGGIAVRVVPNQSG